MPLDDVVGILAHLFLRPTQGFNFFVSRPDEIIAERIVLSLLRFQKPGVLIAAMAQNQVDQDLQPLPMCCLDKGSKIIQRPVVGMHPIVVLHIVFVVRRGGVDGHQPKGFHSQVLEVIQFVDQSADVPNAIAIAIEERLYENLVGNAAWPALNQNVL